MAFTDALRLIIDADTQGAVRGIEKLGATAEKELGKSEDRLDKWGSKLTSLGAGMIAFGGAALVGLGALAKQSEEANLAQVKLQNTIDNMPKLAGATASEFTDLADSIQDVTAANGDAIVEAEALLGTFSLTADEIKGITPLVVDYARKFGIDMSDAAIQVGKALDGQSGALKRNGVSIDEALFATDRYRAVQEALSDQVGGFAEAEGKTFAGSLERMKNELGDLAEGVGGGAVDAFTTMFGAVDSLAGALESVSPGAQNLIGEIATFGAVALIAVGGITTLIGQLIKARDTFLAAKIAAAEFGITLKTVAVGGAVIGGLIAIREVLGGIGDELDNLEMSKLERQLLDSADAGKLAGDVLTEALHDIFEGTDLAGQQGAQALDDLDKALASLAAKDPKAAAAAFDLIAEKAREAGLTTSQVKNGFDDYTAAVTAADTANRTTGAAIDEATGALGEEGDAADETAESTRNLVSAIQAHADALAAQFDPLFGMVSALRSSRDAQLEVADAQTKLNEALAGGDPTKIAEAQRDYDDALSGASDTMFDVQRAQLTLNDAIAKGDVNLEDAQTQMFNWAVQAGFTAEEALIMAGQLGTAATAAHDLGMQDPTVAVNMVGTDAVIAEAANIKAKLDAVPREVNIVTRLSTIVSGTTNIPLRAGGGPVEAGRPYIVGERQAELFVPNQSGRILPSVPGGGGTTVVYSLSFNGPVNDRQVIESIKRFERSNGTSWRN